MMGNDTKHSRKIRAEKEMNYQTEKFVATPRLPAPMFSSPWLCQFVFPAVSARFLQLAGPAGYQSQLILS
jgi:hypothetical protein